MTRQNKKQPQAEGCKGSPSGFLSRLEGCGGGGLSVLHSYWLVGGTHPAHHRFAETRTAKLAAQVKTGCGYDRRTASLRATRAGDRHLDIAVSSGRVFFPLFGSIPSCCLHANAGCIVHAACIGWLLLLCEFSRVIAFSRRAVKHRRDEPSHHQVTMGASSLSIFHNLRSIPASIQILKPYAGSVLFL